MNCAYRKSATIVFIETQQGYSPTSGKLLFSEDSMSHKSAYDKAIQFIMQDPEHNLCEITWWLGWGYTLQCWTVSNTTPTTFSHRGGEHFLFFSEMLFKWKDHVGHGLPRRMPTPCLVSKFIPSKIQPTNDEYNSYQVRHLRFIKLLSRYFT